MSSPGLSKPSITFAAPVHNNRMVSKPEINSLVIIDLIYGISAGLVLVTGLLRWFVVDVKGIEFFSKNPLFHIKLTLFVVIIILSIFPTMKFLKWKKQARHDDGYVPNKKEIKQQLIFIRIELLLMAIIPLLAVMIAKGGRI